MSLSVRILSALFGFSSCTAIHYFSNGFWAISVFAIFVAFVALIVSLDPELE